jgi:hypothetical protein
MREILRAPTPAEPPSEDFVDPFAALSPFKRIAWRELTPRERLRRSWALRARLKDAAAAHDRKLFPAP